MSYLLRVAVVCAVCLLAEAAPDGRLGRAKQQRPTRGFKNVEMMTARGFGKRDGSRAEHAFVLYEPNSEMKNSFDTNEDIDADHLRYRQPGNTQYLMAQDFGKQPNDDQVYGLDNFWDMLESPERDTQDIVDDKPNHSIPLDWFVNELLNNPEFARSVVRKFIDINQDGMLSSEELLRNVA